MQSQKVHENLLALVKREKEILSKILEQLKIIQEKRIFAQRGHSSLFVYMVKELKYSEAAAYRRINALKIIREIPEVKTCIEEGSLNLSNLASASAKIRDAEKENNEKIQSPQRKEIFSSLIGKTKTEAQNILSDLLPAKNLPQERVDPLSLGPKKEKFFKLNITLTEEQMKSLRRLKELSPKKSFSEIIAQCLINQQKKNDPLEKSKRKRSQNETKKKDLFSSKTKTSPTINRKSKNLIADASPKVSSGQNKDGEGLKYLAKNSAPTNKTSDLAASKSLSRRKSKTRPYISANIKKEIWQRDHGECQFVDHHTNRKCRERSFLEIDHLLPFSMGGGDDVDNLQLVCRAHNQLRAERKLGKKFARSFGKRRMA